MTYYVACLFFKLGDITVFKIFIWVGILSDQRSEILFYRDALAEPLNMISDRIYNGITP